MCVGTGLFVTLTPSFHSLLHFRGQRQNHFFHFNKAMPPFEDHYKC